MSFVDALQTCDVIIENAPLGTRLKYDYGISEVADLTECERGRKALIELYQGDIEVALQYHIPFILNAATFRASRNHLSKLGFRSREDVQRINMHYIHLVKVLRNRYAKYKTPIFIGASLGSMYDAYSVDVIPSIEEVREYHLEQISVFKKAEVDFVNIVTIPSLSEAIGIALVAEQSEVDYTIGFILNKQGTLLDGTSLDAAIYRIDTVAKKRPPLGYLITCAHTSVIMQLIMAQKKHQRLIGAQPNGSNLTPKELAIVNRPLTDSPEEFTTALMYIKKQFNLKIIGGCCGTSREHLRSLSKACSIELKQPF